MRLKNNTKISICGMIGAGKSTLTKNLSEVFGVPYLPEFKEDDPVFRGLMDLFYAGHNCEFEFQSYFIKTHFQGQQAMGTVPHFVDTHLYSHAIFADENLPTTIEKNVYKVMFHMFLEELKTPDFIVILKISDDVVIERMRKRARPEEMANFEKNIDYFKRLNKKFNTKMIAHCTLESIPYVIVDVDNKSELEVLDEVKTIIEDGGFTWLK